jgi:hypothetical protein
MEWRTQRPAKRPGMIEPCIPTRATKPPVGAQWIHEIKHDGYRLIARKRDGRVRLFTRNGFDWSDRYPRISAAVAVLATASATIDGEAVWCDGAGLAIFDKLYSRAYDAEVILYAFDMLELDGEDRRPGRSMRARLVSRNSSPRPRPAYTTPSTSRAMELRSSRTLAGSAPRALSRSTASTLTDLDRPRLGLRPRTRVRLPCSGFGKSHDRARSDQPLHPIL